MVGFFLPICCHLFVLLIFKMFLIVALWSPREWLLSFDERYWYQVPDHDQHLSTAGTEIVTPRMESWPQQGCFISHEYARKVCWWCVVSHNVSVQWDVVQICVSVKTLKKIAEPRIETFGLPICDCLVEGIWSCIRLDNCIFSCLHKH